MHVILILFSTINFWLLSLMFNICISRRFACWVKGRHQWKQTPSQKFSSFTTVNIYISFSLPRIHAWQECIDWLEKIYMLTMSCSPVYYITSTDPETNLTAQEATILIFATSKALCSILGSGECFEMRYCRILADEVCEIWRISFWFVIL